MIFLLLQLFSGSVGAATSLPGCGQDILRFCVQVPNERLWVEKCLHKNHDSLSAECVATSYAKIVWLADFADHCIHDRERFCNGTPAEKSALQQCLGSVRSELRPTCSEWITHAD